MNRAVVYAVQQPVFKNNYGQWISKGYDLASIETYGDIKYVWTPEPDIKSRSTMETMALQIARNYKEDVDFVLAIGSPSLIAMIGWAIGVEGKTIRLLQWDRKRRKYIEVLVP